VDPPITVAQATALAHWIESFGKRLTYIYITHWHADHWLAASELAKRFPGVTVYASEATIGRMVKSTPDGVPGTLWMEWFPGQLPQTPIPVLARPVPAGGFTVDGHPVVAVEAGHSDTDDTTVLHAPSIGLVAAGDVVYNNVHQYLAETPGGGLEAWHRALDVVETLRPANVVAGHKDPSRDDSPPTSAKPAATSTMRPDCSRPSQPARSSTPGCSSATRSASTPTRSGCPPAAC
jgi:glyoxylase-like metal-dependent hydrolase (beta-lactamase superfamily II)